jgi:heptosyltransferase-3
MCAKSNIIDELRKKIARVVQESQRGVILQPGAIGDCILTLPLAELMKETVCKGGVDLVGHTEFMGILPGRSCVDAVRSMDSMSLHRLFAKEWEFALADGDPLIMAFAGYTWIVTFLGEPNSDFEQNLIFTANCSHSAEVMMLAMKPEAKENKPAAAGKHISEFYKEQFIEQSGLAAEDHPTWSDSFGHAQGRSPHHRSLGAAVGMPMIRPTEADIVRGRKILAENGVMPTRKPVVIHPGSGGEYKCWHLDNFLSVAQILMSEGVEVIFLLGPAEMERFSASATAKIGSVAGRLANLPLADVLVVLSNAAGYIGNDSGITHLAAALGVRTVAVFGPTNPLVYGPIGPAVTILRNDAAVFTETVSKKMQQQICEILLS